MGEYKLPDDYKASIHVEVNPEEKTLEIISLTKMSWSEYTHFLIIGKMFSLLFERLPFFASILITPVSDILS